MADRVSEESFVHSPCIPEHQGPSAGKKTQTQREGDGLHLYGSLNTCPLGLETQARVRALVAPARVLQWQT